MTITITDPHDAPIAAIDPVRPHVIVLFGATGDLARRKLIPGLLHLSRAGLMSEFRIVGVSLEPLDTESFRAFARAAWDEFGRDVISEDDWNDFATRLSYVRTAEGAEGLRQAAARAAAQLGESPRYLSLPERPARGGALGGAGARRRRPDRARADHHGEALRHRPRERRPAQRRRSTRSSPTAGSSASTTSWARRRRRTSSPCASPTGSSSPSGTASTSTTSRSTSPRPSPWARAAAFYERTGAFRDMVVTHLLQVLAFTAMEPPTALEPGAINEEKNKVFRSLVPIEPHDVVRGQYERLPRRRPGAPSTPRPRPSSRCAARSTTGAGRACPSSCAPASAWPRGRASSRSPSRSPRAACSRRARGSGQFGPDHLTFDLADASRLSLSFYGKRPGPGMRAGQAEPPVLAHEDAAHVDLLEAYERLIYDAMMGDHTLFANAKGIERLWEVSQPLLRTRRRCSRTRRARGARRGHERPHPSAHVATAVRAQVAGTQVIQG